LQAKLAMNDRAICFKFGKKQKKQGDHAGRTYWLVNRGTYDCECAGVGQIRDAIGTMLCDELPFPAPRAARQSRSQSPEARCVSVVLCDCRAPRRRRGKRQLNVSGETSAKGVLKERQLPTRSKMRRDLRACHAKLKGTRATGHKAAAPGVLAAREKTAVKL
jgi:hypothetical protein